MCCSAVTSINWSRHQGRQSMRSPRRILENARKYAPGAREDRGQYIFWGAGGEGAVQEMTELTECKRAEDQDDWFLAVQDEFRRGALSERTRNLLHGKPTDVPGSWVNGLRCAETPVVSKT